MPVIAQYEGNLITAYLDPKDLRIADMAHGCNCFHSMGAGIAREVSKRIPKALAADKLTDYGDEHKLGTFSSALTHKKVNGVSSRIFNLYTQLSLGADARYKAVEDCFTLLNAEYVKGKSTSILGVPLIGAGIGGLDWAVVEHIIDQATPNIQVAVFTFKP